MTPDLGTFALMIQTFFTQTTDQVARAEGLVERVSKLTGSLFLQTLVFGFLDHPDASLNGLTDTSQDLGVTLTKQGLQSRIENAVGFLTEMFQQAMVLFRNELPLNLKVLNQFTAIFLTDSSTVAVPDLLQDEFPGCGGDGPDAAIKIQLTFDFLRGRMSGIRFQAGRTRSGRWNNCPVAWWSSTFRRKSLTSGGGKLVKPRAARDARRARATSP